MGYGSCQIAAFVDEEVNGVMGLEPGEESAIYMTAVGTPFAQDE
jgi:hypothetical protein